MLVVEKEVQLQDILLLLCGDIAFHSEMADVIEFYFLFVVSEEKGFGEKGRGGVVDACSFDDLIVVVDGF